MAGEEELSHLPGLLRDRVELVESAVEEPPHPSIYRFLMEEGTRSVIEEYLRRKKAVAAKSSIQKNMAARLGVRHVNRDLVEELEKAFSSGELKVVGIDAGTNGLNLEVAYIPLCCAMAALCARFDIADCMPRAPERIPFWDDELAPDKHVQLLGFRLQFELVVKAARKWKPDFILFDGPFLMGWLWPPGLGGPVYKEDFEKTIKAGVKALDFCVEKGIPIIGFVKRPQGCKVAEKLAREGYLPRAVRDTVALRWLSWGTYLRPFYYVSRSQKPRDFWEVGSSMADEYFKMAKELDVELDHVSVAFTYVNTGYTFPYKIEIPEVFIDRLDEIIALLFVLRATRGIPFPIYAADLLTKVSNTTRDLFLLSLRARLAEEAERGRLSREDLEMFMPRYGESYGLSEEEFERASRSLASGRRIGGRGLR